MTLKPLLAAGATVLSLCAAAQDQPVGESKKDHNPALAKPQDQKPAARREGEPASAGPSTAAKAGPYGEQPPAVSPAGSSSERTAEPKEGGEDKHDAPTGETPKQGEKPKQ
jgi:hypothetical protein